MPRKLIIALASALAFAAFAAPASARTGDGEVRHYQQRVYFGDLDINAETGAERLLRRINLAARDVCREPYRLPLSARAAERACIQEANDEAVAKIDSPTVLALYVARTGRDPRRAAIAMYERS